jgi:hypothetical protein
MSLVGGKGNYQSLIGKKGDYAGRFMSGVKGVARLADDPFVQFGVAALAPEVAGGLALAKKTGLLKKVAGM